MSAARPITATVLATCNLAPDLRRLVLGGGDLRALLPPPGALGPYLKLHLADAEGCERIRTYSLRHFDLQRGELHVDIALHGEDSVGSRFALQARPGDKVGLRGPGVIPAPPCRSYLLAGDHTALPAIARTLETLPGDVAVTVVLETPNPDARCLLAYTGRDICCLQRRPGEPSRLMDAVSEATPQKREDLMVWAGAEAGIARAIRKYARTTLRLPPARCQILNYWKAGRAEGEFDCMA
ncbi:siderophore-interacting protein [Labrys okinawensis]|uniref:siderophore-interacting protein n=1 Tax=Labrys okinawensis TaxID=346911 RepID=UPI0039BCEFD8